jgi:hypothetical protein
LNLIKEFFVQDLNVMCSMFYLEIYPRTLQSCTTVGNDCSVKLYLSIARQ